MSNDKVNWEQAKVDAAIAAMQSMAGSNWWSQLYYNVPDAKGVSEQIAHRAVLLADALIAELKKTNETN